MTTKWPQPDPAVGTSFDPTCDYRPSWKHYLKTWVYPSYHWLNNRKKKNTYGLSESLDDPNIIMDGRGSEYDYLIFKLGRSKIAGKKILLQGVGDGRELTFWKHYHPKVIAAVDLYPREDEIEASYDFAFNLIKGDLEALPFPDQSFEGIASINVYEHIMNLDKVCVETKRVLAPNGFFIASFGPLYHTIGGDHLSSIRGGLEHGYNHLLLAPDRYQEWLKHIIIEGVDRSEKMPHYTDIDLFSRLKYQDYYKAFKAAFHLHHFSAHVNDEALLFRGRFPDKWKELRDKGYSESDLLVGTVTVIAELK